MGRLTPGRDSRGERVSAVRPSTTAGDRRPGVGARIRSALFGRFSRAGYVCGAVMGLGVAGLPIVFLSRWYVLSSDRLDAIALVIIGLIVVPAVVYGWIVHRRPEPTAWLGLGLCPACGYSIAEIEPEEDGCRVCPECGSAWRLPS